MKECVPEDGWLAASRWTFLDFYAGLFTNRIDEADRRAMNTYHIVELNRQRNTMRPLFVRSSRSSLPGLDFRPPLSSHSHDTPCSTVGSSRMQWLWLDEFSYKTLSHVYFIDRHLNVFTRPSMPELDERCWRHVRMIPTASNPLLSTVFCNRE